MTREREIERDVVERAKIDGIMQEFAWGVNRVHKLPSSNRIKRRVVLGILRWTVD